VGQARIAKFEVSFWCFLSVLYSFDLVCKFVLLFCLLYVFLVNKESQLFALDRIHTLQRKGRVNTFNKNSAIAEMVAQCCTSRTFAVECGYLALTHTLLQYL